MADKVYYNPSLGIQSITPAIDDDTFLFFLETYYDWMQTTDITFNGSNGPFANGEIITGQDSRATATIRYVDTSNNLVTVSMKTDKPFDLGEEIVGGTSANSAFVLELSDNVLRKASRIRDNKNPQQAQGLFLEYLKQELNKGIPSLTQADRRKLVAQLRDFFKSKSTEEAYTFLFRALFNETIEIRYPGDDLLRVSDGNFIKQSIIRVGERSAISIAGTANVVSGNALVIGTNTEFTDLSTSDHIRVGTQQAVVANVINATHLLTTTNFSTTANNKFLELLPEFDIFALKNKTVRGRTSGAVAVIADLRVSFLGGLRYADLILRLLSGEFQENEILEDIDNTGANTIVYGVVGSITINDGGTGYALNDQIVISGDGAEARATVTSISEAPISKITVANTGIGYRNNIEATINNSGTGGTGFRVRINEIANTYTVGANNEYTVGDTVVVSIINRGSGYKALPTITLQDTAVSSLGLLHEKLIRIDDAGRLYEVGDTLVFSGGSGANVAGQVAAVTERWVETPVILVSTEVVLPYKDESLLDDFGSLTVLCENDVGILLEQDYEDRLKMEDWRGVGPIERIELTNFGSGYTYPSGLPTVTVSSANGVNASLTVFDIQGRSAVVEIDSANNVAGIGAIREVTILDQGINYTSATVDASGSGDGNANLTADISGIFVNPGYFQNDDGKVNYKVLQDSLFYQDFSYVIRSGLSFDQYKEIVKESVHPAGLEFFGEIVITNTISAVAQFTSEVIADRAPRFVSLFSFLSLWDTYAIVPPTQESIVVKIKPFVSYTDNAKLDAHREINIEIAPTVINVAALTSTEYRPILTPSVDIGIFGGASVTVIASPPAKNEYDIILAGANVFITLDTGAVREVDITPEAANLQINWIEWQDLNVPKQVNFEGAVLGAIPTTQYEIDIQSVRANDTSLLPYVWGDFFTLGEYAEIAISQLANQTFDVPVYGIGSTRNEYNIEFPPTVINQGVDVFGTEEFPLIKTLVSDVTDVTSDLTKAYKIDLTLNLPMQLGFNTNPFIQINSFVDATMEFYSSIISMQNEIRTTEIDIELFNSVSSSISNSYKIETETLASVATILQLQKFVIQPNSFIDATLAFYSDIVTMQNEVRTTEIDISLFKSITINVAPKLEIDIFNHVGTPEFVNGNEDYFYKDVRLRQFRDVSILEVQDRAFNMISGDDTIRKNIPTGLASTPTIQYQEALLSFFAEDTINSYSAITFGEVSNLRRFVLGSNTTFLDDFLVNDYIVVADEKFIIKSISNNTFLEINVSAAQNHNNVPSYREIFV